MRSPRWHAIPLVRVAVPMLLLALVAALASPAAAARPAQVIVLPGASSAEGIAAGRGATFYAGDLFAGDIFRGNLQRGTAERFIDAPTGRMAVGMKVDVAHQLLFVAGGFTGQGYIYDTATGATVASYQFGSPTSSLINDVALTKDGAWFTDSFQAQLYFVPVSRAGVPASTFRTLALSGPAATVIGNGTVNLNGIQATPDGKTLIVAHSATAQLDTVDPATGASATIAGISPGEPDPAGPGPLFWGGGGGHHQPAVPGANHRGPLRQQAGGGERQVRHRHPTDCQAVRGDPRRPVSMG
jgi:sugar lactone lactonase YvrE